MSFLQRRARQAPSVEVFYSDMSYGTRLSHEAISKMADETADALGQVSECFSDLIEQGSKVLGDIKSSDTQYSEKEERKMVSNFQDSEDRLMLLHEDLVEKENFAVCDPGLFGNNESTVTSAYKECIKSIEKLVQIVQDIRWEIMHRSEAIDEVTGVYDSAEDLISSMK